MPSRNRAEVTTIGQVPQWPQRLIVAHLDCTTGQLSCGFEGGYGVHISLSRLEIPNRPCIIFAAPDEFGSGILFLREDGTTTDCGADMVLEIASGVSSGETVSASNDDLSARVAERLRGYRDGHNLTQRAMAERLGMAASNYNRLESGKHTPAPVTLLRIAEAMGVPLGRLVSF